MNKIVSIKLPILALAMVFTISCSSDKDSGENLSSPNEQSSSSSFVQSSSSGISHSCPLPNCSECNESGLCKGYFYTDYPDYPDWPMGCVGLVAPEYDFYYPLPPDGEPLQPDNRRFCVPELDKSSSSSSVQSSSSGINNCAPPQIVPIVVGTGTEYVTGCAILEPHFIDARDGEIYRYVEIGTQTWMADNLNYDVSNNDTDVCYDNDPVNCTKYGRLYNWATAMALPSKCNSTPTSGADCAIKNPNHQGICPSGWHIPSNSEWDALYRSVDGTSGTDSPYESPTAGKDLKAKFAWIDCGPSSSGEDYLCEDTHRFSARPGGYGNSDGDFSFVGSNGSWWSASEWSSYSAYLRSINHYDEGANYKGDIKNNLYSVRCIKDN